MSELRGGGRTDAFFGLVAVFADEVLAGFDEFLGLFGGLFDFEYEGVELSFLALLFLDWVRRAHPGRRPRRRGPWT